MAGGRCPELNSKTVRKTWTVARVMKHRLPEIFLSHLQTDEGVEIQHMSEISADPLSYVALKCVFMNILSGRDNIILCKANNFIGK